MVQKGMGPSDEGHVARKPNPHGLGSRSGKDGAGANPFRPEPATAIFSLPPHLPREPGQLSRPPVRLPSFSLALL